jgi:[CysO sulfur-carrier protein]-S-L-cysteine hydrolase
VIVKIPRAVIDEIIAHARQDAPNECCGLLIGRRDVVHRSFRARNLEPTPTRYLIDPKDHFAALRDARAERLQVIGAYHSHPNTDPVPSPSDIAESFSGSRFVYLIVSLKQTNTPSYGAYLLKSDGVEQVKLEEN